LGEFYDDFRFWLPQEDAIHSFQSHTFPPDFDSALSLKSSLPAENTSTADTPYISNFSLPLDPLFPSLEIPYDIASQNSLGYQSSIFFNTAPPRDTAGTTTSINTTSFIPPVLNDTTTGRNNGSLHDQSPYGKFENLEAASQFDNISVLHVHVSDLSQSIPSFDERQSKYSRQPTASVIEISSTTCSALNLHTDSFSDISPPSMVESNPTVSIKSSDAPSNSNSPSSLKSASSTPKRTRRKSDKPVVGNNNSGCRGTKRCIPCRRHKQKCEYDQESNQCQRCRRKNIPVSECVKVYGKARELKETAARVEKERQETVREGERALFGEEWDTLDIWNRGPFVPIQPG